MSRSMWIVFVAILVAVQGDDVPSRLSFNFESGGSYSIQGTTYIADLTANGSVPSPTTYQAGFAIDTVGQQYFMNISNTSQQIGFPNGTYFVNFNPVTRAEECWYRNDVNYPSLITLYHNAIQDGSTIFQKQYSGLIKDVGTCGTPVNAHFTTVSFLGKEFLQQWTTALYLNGLPRLCYPVKVSLTFEYDLGTLRLGTPSESFFQLPSICFNTSTTPSTDYCSAYYGCNVLGDLAYR